MGGWGVSKSRYFGEFRRDVKVAKIRDPVVLFANMSNKWVFSEMIPKSQKVPNFGIYANGKRGFAECPRFRGISGQIWVWLKLDTIWSCYKMAKNGVFGEMRSEAQRVPNFGLCANGQVGFRRLAIFGNCGSDLKVAKIRDPAVLNSGWLAYVFWLAVL